MYLNLCNYAIATGVIMQSNFGILCFKNGRPSPCRFLCIFVLAGECIEEWNGAAGRRAGTSQLLPERLTWEEMSRSTQIRKVPRQTNFQKEWRGSKFICA